MEAVADSWEDACEEKADVGGALEAPLSPAREVLRGLKVSESLGEVPEGLGGLEDAGAEAQHRVPGVHVEGVSDHRPVPEGKPEKLVVGSRVTGGRAA